MILESPKSAINRSELSSAVLNNKFSGFKSTPQGISISQRDSSRVKRKHTPMHNSVVMKISHGRQCCSDDIRGIGFVVKSFSTDSVEELSSQSKIGNEVYYPGSIESVFHSIIVLLEGRFSPNSVTSLAGDQRFIGKKKISRTYSCS